MSGVLRSSGGRKRPSVLILSGLGYRECLGRTISRGRKTREWGVRLRKKVFSLPSRVPKGYVRTERGENFSRYLRTSGDLDLSEPFAEAGDAREISAVAEETRRGGDLAKENRSGALARSQTPRSRKVLSKLKGLEEARGQMAGAGPTMLLREENGCCSRRQSSSSAGDSDGEREDSPSARARQQLEALLNKTMRIRMTDGRTLVGCFLCTDRDCNVILGSAQEFLKPSDSFSAGEPRVLGLAMVPGHHIVSIEVQRESLAGPPYL
uniref:Sm domain-containing protein n=2 Tax=Sus scrofa TaxID=9823 RepID=A0A4X1V5R0_PIG